MLGRLTAATADDWLRPKHSPRTRATWRRGCATLLRAWFAVRSPAIATGRRRGEPAPKPPTTSSSSAPAGTASPRPIISPRSTASGRRRPREGLARRRQHRAKHDGRALQLLLSQAPASTIWRCELWEGLEPGLNFNVMLSQRGELNLYHSDGQRDAYARRGNGMRLSGIDAVFLDRDDYVGSCRSRFRQRPPPDPAGCCSGAAAPPATMPWRGASPAPPIRAASTSSRTARWSGSVSTAAA